MRISGWRILQFHGPAALAFCAVAIFVLMAGMPAKAQDREIRALDNKVERLEEQLRSITRYLSNNEDAPRDFAGGTDGAQPGQMADLLVRLSDFEKQLRDMTGQIEELRYEVQQVDQRLTRLSEDYEYRLQQLEGTGGAPATADADADDTAGPDTGTADTGGGPFGVPAPDETGAPTEDTTDTAQTLPSGEPVAMYDAALSRLRQEDYQAAAEDFQSFLTAHPDNELAANARYWLGESYYAQGDFSDAARAFLDTYQKHPQSGKASGALLKLGISLGELDQKQDACAALREFDQSFPQATSIEKSRADRAKQDLNCP